jgi:hypothetical protein
VAAAQPRTAQAARPESKASDLMRDPVRVLRTLVEELLEVSRPNAGAEQAYPATPIGTGGHRSHRRWTAPLSSYATRARASAELLARGPQRLRTGAAESGRGQGLGLTIAPVQAQAIQARPEFARPAHEEGHLPS